EAVRLLKREGVDFIKVHTRLSQQAYLAAADEAKKQGLSFAGHVPQGVSLAEAAKAGQKSIEHLSEYGLLFECSGKPGVSLGQIAEAYSAEKCRALFDLFKQNDTWQTPTLGALQTFAKSPAEIEAELRSKGYLKYVGPALMRFWTESEKLAPPPPEEIRRELKPLARKAIEVVGEMHSQGVNILAGCDALTPGLCLHDELELIVRAGLSPMEALQTATRNPARFLGKLDSFGTVERGKIADLVILDANPLENIGNIRRINSVVVDGKYLPPGMLKKMLAEVESAAAGKPASR
ncbi:MAG TPA: amidohydrolase family protein, partial [Blastocatellia bacterium]|nr:amidohydrolase family protein [Blastocatellia bacterium]